VEKHGRARQTTDDNVTRRMRFTCCTTKAIDTHSEYVLVLAFFTITMLLRTRLYITFIGTLPVKAIPVQVWTSPEVSRRLRLPDFKAHKCGKVVSPTHRPPLPLVVISVRG
jgi:hypothetical protein